ncbi:MAG: hypothetical protein ACTSSI_15010, partial [Candidatus Helarchaeota archaeon]
MDMEPGPEGEEVEEEISLTEVVLEQERDSDKFTILAKAIETILQYTEKLETNDQSINEYLNYYHQTLTNILSTTETLSRRVGDMERRFEKLVAAQLEMAQRAVNVASSTGLDSEAEHRILSEISAIRTKINDVEERCSSFQSQLTQLKSAGITALGAGVETTTTTARGQVVEEGLLKPSAFGAGGGGGGAHAGAGGPMSIRAAMMSEIKSKMGARGGGPSAKPMGGGGYIPKIQKPREAKPLGKSIVGKMNKLLDQKFAKTAPQGAKSIKIDGKAPPPQKRAPPGFGSVPKESKKKDKDKKK